MARQAEVVVWRRGEVVSRYALTPGELRLGRSKEADLRLDAPAVSRDHAVVRVTDASISIHDRGSGNGLFCRGGKVLEKTVRDGDLVFVDPFVLEFRIQEVAAHTTEPRPRALPRLVWINGPKGVVEFALVRGSTCIGRGEGRKILVDDQALSRKHAEVLASPKGFVVRDAASANGTYVNGRRVHEALLQPGDEIRVGAQLFRFELGTTAAETRMGQGVEDASR